VFFRRLRRRKNTHFILRTLLIYEGILFFKKRKRMEQALELVGDLGFEGKSVNFLMRQGGKMGA